MDYLVFLGRHFREHLLPRNPVHPRRIRKKPALQLFHHIHHAPCVVEVHNRIRPAGNHCVDTRNLRGIFFKIIERHTDSQLIRIGLQMQDRIGRACNRHVKHDRIHQNLSCNQLRRFPSRLHQLYRIRPCLSCLSELCIVRCRNRSCSGKNQIQHLSKHLHRIGRSHGRTCPK